MRRSGDGIVQFAHHRPVEVPPIALVDLHNNDFTADVARVKLDGRREDSATVGRRPGTSRFLEPVS